MSAEFTKQLEQALRPVAGRLRRASVGPQLVRAVLFGAAIALVPALVRLLTGSLAWGLASLVVAVALPLVVLMRAWRAGLDMRRAALAIDKHYAWQDRLTTAWSALSVGGLTPLEQFQAAQAARFVAQVAPAKVVPLALPAGLLKAGVVVCLLLCALAWPIGYHGKSSDAPAEGPVPAVAKPGPAARPVPSVSGELAAASWSQLRSARGQGPTGDHRALPAPDRRLIHEYFQAVCPPGR